MSTILDVPLEGTEGDTSRQIIPPQGYRVGPETRIGIQAWSSVVNNLVLQGRVYSGGKYYSVQLALLTTSDRAANSTQVSISGVLISCVVASSGGVKRGQTYVEVRIQHDGLSFLRPIKDYAFEGHWPSWPGGEQHDSNDGPGAIRVISLGDPAAGADYATVTVPTQARWKVKGFAGALVAAVAVANRRLRIDYDDGANVFGGAVVGSQIAASNTNNLRGGIGFGSSVGNTSVENNGGIAFGLPDTYLDPGYRISFVTNNLQAADDWGAGFLEVEEWISP